MDKKVKDVHMLMRICCSVAVYLVAYLFILSLVGNIPFLQTLPLMYLNAAAMGVAAAVLLFTIKKEEFAFERKGKKWKNIMAVVLLAYSTSALFNILLGSIPWQEIVGSDVTPDEDVYYGIPLLARMVCYEVIAPVAEELLFRQVTFTRLKKIAPVWVAVVVSALIFGLYHGNLVQGIYAFIMGIFLALVYEWTGSFLYPVLFHMIANHLSDICYEFEKLGEVVYSVPGAIAASFIIVVAVCMLCKKQNKCSKNTLQSS